MHASPTVFNPRCCTPGASRYVENRSSTTLRDQEATTGLTSDQCESSFLRSPVCGSPALFEQAPATPRTTFADHKRSRRWRAPFLKARGGQRRAYLCGTASHSQERTRIILLGRFRKSQADRRGQRIAKRMGRRPVLGRDVRFLDGCEDNKKVMYIHELA